MTNSVCSRALIGLLLLVGGAVVGCESPSQTTGNLESCCPATSQDWPQYRGLSRDGIGTSNDLAEEWPSEGPAELWRKPIGAGFSGIVVKGESLYTLWVENKVETLFRLDALTGEEIWRRPIDQGFEEEYGEWTSVDTDDRRYQHHLCLQLSRQNRCREAFGRCGALGERSLH